jgi:hypothetical protein
MSLSSTATTLTLTPSDAGGDNAAAASAVLASLPSQQSPSLSAPLEQTPPFEIHSSQHEEDGNNTTPPPVLRRMGAFVAATPSPASPSWASTSSLSIYGEDEDDDK